MVETFKQKYINILAIFCVFSILILSGFSYYEIKGLRESDHLVIHSHEVIEQMYNLTLNLEKATSGQRGYLLTGNSSYLNSYQQNKQEIIRIEGVLISLTKDNYEQNNRVLNLATIIQARVALLDYVLTTASKKNLESGVDLILTGKGRLLAIGINNLVDDFIREEKKLLLERVDISYQNTASVISLILIGDLVILGLILLCIYLLNKQLESRISAEKKVRESEEKLYKLAYYDSLTGLPNRILLLKKIDDLTLNLNKHQMLAFLLLDIDNFKHINDSLGHEVGDELILACAAKLKKLIRDEDIVSHFGGDEFVIVLTEMERIKDISSIAKKIQTAFLDPFQIGPDKIYITISIGISVYPNNGLDAKTLIKNADIAMYQAKEMGRNNFQYCTPEMSHEVEEQALLHNELHQALQLEEFTLLYQPKISLKNEKIIGLEALMRWNKPGEGLVSPDYFISIAETNGLIVPMGEWMLRTVCLQIKKWHAEGLMVDNIAINISMRQFSIGDFVASVKKILDETKINPNYLEFEITERVFMENSTNNFALLQALKAMGIKITLDDFGTGYSSLSYLRLFDIDKLKIDKSFIDPIVDEHSDASIINAIIIMAHSLGIKVVAEGVETIIQAEVLKKYNCDEVQGYLYSHPLSADDIENKLKQ